MSNFGKRRVLKIIDYAFQHEFQLTEAYDDSNTMIGLSDDLDKYVLGRFGSSFSIHETNGYRVIFLPVNMSTSSIADYVLSEIKPDVIHLHGNHGWPHYQYYADVFRKSTELMIFSPAGSSCGTPNFIKQFDYVVVNHRLQVDRIKCYPEDKRKILVRRRAANPTMFFPTYLKGEYPAFSFVYISAFVPGKQILSMISDVLYQSVGRNLAIVGDFNRTREHYEQIQKYLDAENLGSFIHLFDFMNQESLVNFLGNCGVFVWPNVKPENPSTTTNRSVIEALACGMPLLLGEMAFKDTEFVEEGFNGYLYSSQEDFSNKAEKIFDDLFKFRRNSSILNKERFSYRENFIGFYNDLYLK